MESWHPNVIDSEEPPSDSHGLGLGAALREQLAAALANQFTINYETLPANPRVSVGGRLLTFTLDGGLTDAERSRLAAGRIDEVRDFRERVLRATAEEMGEVVETLLPATKVSHFFVAFDPETRTTSCFFILERLDDARHEQREAVCAWSEQARRKARGLRALVETTQKANANARQRFVALREGSIGA